MRTRSLVVTTATLLWLSACGGGGTRMPVAPSAGISVVPGAASGGQAGATAPVSWACFTSVAPGAFGSAGCATRVTTSRLLPSAAGAPISAPGAPTGLSGTASGSVVTLSWTAPVGGDAPTSYVVEAGSATGLTDIASFNTGTNAVSLAVFNVPAATYFVRLRAVNSAGTSGASNEIQLVVGSGGAPCATLAAPTGLAASVTGSTVVLTWTAPAGCAPITYIIQAGSTPGSSNLANFSTGSTATTYTATGVGNGTYYVRVTAAVTGILSASSNEIVLTLPPAPPSAGIVAGFQFFDPGTQTAATTSCRIVSELTQSPTVCQARSTSFTTGTNTIVLYEWTVEYFYVTAKTVTQSSTDPTITFGDTCGGPGSTDDGVAVPVRITLTVTDNLGAKVTVVSGTGSQPALQLRLFTC